MIRSFSDIHLANILRHLSHGGLDGESIREIDTMGTMEGVSAWISTPNFEVEGERD